MFSGIFGLRALNMISTYPPQVVKTKNVSTEGKICPLLRTTALTFQLPTEKKGYPSFSEIT